MTCSNYNYLMNDDMICDELWKHVVVEMSVNEALWYCMGRME